MKKKLFKYIKFLVSLVLILSLVAPSYASLGASDGSAFVTKAEFDSALADFNARLTTFEAGINSKIDSQVTSYLDRNGIWNGKVVDFLPDDAYTLWNDKTEAVFVWNLSVGTSTQSFTSATYASTAGSAKSLYAKLVSSTTFDDKILFKAVKSGLIYLPTTFRTQYSGNQDVLTESGGSFWAHDAGINDATITFDKIMNTNKTGGNTQFFGGCFANSTNSFQGSGGMPNINPSITISNNDGTIMNTYAPYSMNLITGYDYGAAYTQPSLASNDSPYMTILFFFVQQGQTYKMNLSFALGGRMANTVYWVGKSANLHVFAAAVAFRNALIY